MAEVKKMIILKASDGDILEVEEAVAKVAGTIRRKIEADGDLVISLPDITPVTLTKVMEYCSKHAAAAASASASDDDDAESDAALKSWDADFIDVDETSLSGIILASDILEVKGLQLLSMMKKVLTLRSMDDMNFAVEAPVVWRMMKTIRIMLLRQPRSANAPIFIPNVNSVALSAVIEYCTKHERARKAGMTKDKINELDRDFIKLYIHNVFDLIRAAVYLESTDLLNLMVHTAKAVKPLSRLPEHRIAKAVVEGHYTQEEEIKMAGALAKLM